MGKIKTIFSKTFIPVLALLLFVISAYMIFIHQYILKSLRDNVIDVYEEQMINSRNDMENQMLKGLSVINGGAAQITKKIENVVESKGYDLSRIKDDINLNQEILVDITSYIIDTLKTSGLTEVFLILDGQGSHKNADIRAGIYIRNSEPGAYVSNNSNILFERGVPAISKGWKLPLDSYWQSGFLFEEEEENEFFFKPLQAARENYNKDFRNFGYWNYAKIIDEKDLGILSYSVPLIGKDGTVFGVLGIGINENLLLKSYNYNEKDKQESRGYILAKTLDGKTFEPYVIKGRSYSKTSILGSKIQLLNEEDDRLYYMAVDTSNSTVICVNRQDFRLYSHNTPFENEQWVLLGIQREKELFYSYYTVRRILDAMLLASGLICTMCVYWFSKFISVPIQQMVYSLRKSDPYSHIYLNKSHIEEIDELAEAIENLSVRVAGAYSKISMIIQMSDSGIAVFEYKKKENIVFCSQGFYEIMGFEKFSESNVYVDATEFRHHMEDILEQNSFMEENIREVSLSGGAKRWIKISLHEDEESILGLVSDVTEDIMEKKKIEYERDHDVLTTLLNRRAFEEKLSQLKESSKDLKQGVMLMWDLDDLKYLNDTYGHNTGDEYLIAFANCLKKFNNENVISARRSGDEFITLIYGYDTVEGIERLIEKIWSLIQNTYIVLEDNRKTKINVSMGKAWYPKDTTDFDTLFHYADFAMYTVKYSEKGTMADFNKIMYEENKILLQGHKYLHNLLD